MLIGGFVIIKNGEIILNVLVGVLDGLSIIWVIGKVLVSEVELFGVKIVE